MVKIATWNVCLGLKSKKEYVKSKIIEEKIDICCIQESEIPKDFLKDRAVVAELVRASYLIDTLSMLKVEGSNPGHPETFFRYGMPR